MSNACLFFYGFIPDELVLKTSDRNDIDSVFSSVGVFADSDDYCHKCRGRHLICVNAYCKFIRLNIENIFGEM